MIEAVPLVSQIVSLAEFFIGILYYYCFPPPLPPPIPLPLPTPELPFENQPLVVFNSDAVPVQYPVPTSLQPDARPMNGDYVHNADYITRCPEGEINERGFFYFRSFSNSSIHPRIAQVLWVPIFSLLDCTDLTNMRHVSHSCNSFIVHTPAIGGRLSFSQSELFAITPKFFQWIGNDPQDAYLRLQRRIILVRRLLSETNESRFPITPDTLSIVQEEFRAPNYYPEVGLLQEGRYQSYSLSLCPRSTRESLFVHFLFLYALYKETTLYGYTFYTLPLTDDSTFHTTFNDGMGAVIGDWDAVVARVLLEYARYMEAPHN